MDQDIFVNVQNLKKHFPIYEGITIKRVTGYVKAVDGISFEIYRGETLGLVGESGCGKTTVGRVILQLYPATAGHVIFDGVDLTTLSPRELRKVRPRMQMIFQDPFSSLNPRMTVGRIIGEPLQIHTSYSRSARARRVRELLDIVGLNRRHERSFPHELSGGQRQRVGVARALALQPDLIVCDEPISALDVSVQAQIVNLLFELQEEFGITYLFIAHDLSMIQRISSRVAVMYLGNLMALGNPRDLLKEPLHPYTQALVSAVPVPDPHLERKRNRIILEGDLPNPSDPPKGCPFNSRCPLAIDRCFHEQPELKAVRPGHFVACWMIE